MPRRRTGLRPPVIALLGGLLACVAGSAAEPEPHEWLENGLSAAERRRFHHVAIGSEMLPLAWLDALATADGQRRFRDELGKYGFLPDPAEPHGLPIGLSVAEGGDPLLPAKVVGITCAACHVGEITHAGRTVRIDGMPNVLFIEEFSKGLTDAMAATVEHPRRLLEFVKRLAAEGSGGFGGRRPDGARLAEALPGFDALRGGGELEAEFAARLEQAVTKLGEEPPLELRDVSAAVRAAGAEVDKAWRHLAGELALDARRLAARGGRLPGLARESEAKLARGLEELWAETIETGRLLRGRVALLRRQMLMAGVPATVGGPGRVDDFGFARNLLFTRADMRPVDAPCSVPVLWGTAGVRWQGWDANNDSAMGRNLATAIASGAIFDTPTATSTALPRNLAAVEEIAARITPPRWPEEWLGRLDGPRVDRGRALFRARCQDCHPADAAAPPDRVVPLAEIGTDPARAAAFAVPLEGRPFAAAIEETLGRYRKLAFERAGIDAAEATRLEEGRSERWRTTGGYAARPLPGIWASAPYLHNGSVPTLDDLLRPPAERPRSFAVGGRHFDPVRVGLAADDRRPPIFVLDTTIPGNRATGHDYGTDLSAAERRDLIEFLKTL